MSLALRQRGLADCGVINRRTITAGGGGKGGKDDGAPPLAIPAARGLGDALPAEARAGDEAAVEVEPAAPSPAKRPPSPGRLPAEAAGGSPPKKPARVEERKEAGAVDAPAPPPNMRKPRAAHAVKAGALTLDPSPAPTKAAGRRQGPAAPKGSAAALPAPRRLSSKPPAPPKRAALKAYRRPDGLTFPVASYAYVALTQEAAEAVGGGREGGGGGGGDREGAPAPLTLRQRFQAGQLGLVRIDAVWREVAPPPPKPRRPAKGGGAGDAAPPPPPAARPPPAYKFRGGWVLPPEATHAGRGVGHGHREVFISSEASTNDAACLVGPALVVRERDFARAPGDDVFFAKYEYNATWQSFRLIDAKYADDGEDADPEAAAAAAAADGGLAVAADPNLDPLAAALARAALASRAARAPVRPLPAPRRKGEAAAAAAGAAGEDGGWGGTLAGGGGGAAPAAPGGGGGGGGSSSDGDGGDGGDGGDSDASASDGDWAPGGQRSLFDAWAKGGVHLPRGSGVTRRAPARRTIRQGGGALGGALGATTADVMGGGGGGSKAAAAAPPPFKAAEAAPAAAAAAAAAAALPPPPPASSALARARSALAPGAPHCGLPTREGELGRLDEFVRAAAAEGGSTTGRCLYVYGVPGTGKTAAVRDAVKRAAAAAAKVVGVVGHHGGAAAAALVQADPATRSHHPAARPPRPFRFVEVNALRLPSPRHVYTRLVEAMDGVRLTPADAHDVLAARFGGTADAGGGGGGGGQQHAAHPSPTAGLSAKAAAAVRAASASRASRPATIVLVDEMDLLLTKSQAVLYNLFEWPTRPGSGLAVIGVANTMDLPDRLLPRIASRLGGRRLPFAPYTAPQLRAILETRLAGAGAAGAFDPRAVLFAARKVAGAAGDVRRALELCRLAADVAVEEGEGAGGGAATASAVVVTMSHVDAAARAMHGASHVQLLAGCAPLDLVALVALAVETRVSGGAHGGASLAAVVARTRELCSLAGGLAGGDGGAPVQPTEADVDGAAARLASMGLLVADGAGPVVGRRFLHLALDAPLPDLVAVVKARAGAEAGLAWLGRVQLE